MFDLITTFFPSIFSPLLKASMSFCHWQYSLVCSDSINDIWSKFSLFQIFSHFCLQIKSFSWCNEPFIKLCSLICFSHSNCHVFFLCVKKSLCEGEILSKNSLSAHCDQLFSFFCRSEYFYVAVDYFHRAMFLIVSASQCRLWMCLKTLIRQFIISIWQFALHFSISISSAHFVISLWQYTVGSKIIGPPWISPIGSPVKQVMQCWALW